MGSPIDDKPGSANCGSERPSADDIGKAINTF